MAERLSSHAKPRGTQWECGASAFSASVPRYGNSSSNRKNCGAPAAGPIIVSIKLVAEWLGAFAGMSQSDQVWRSVLTCTAVGDVRERERHIATVATRYVRASDAEFGFVPTINSVRLPLKSPSGVGGRLR